MAIRQMCLGRYVKAVSLLHEEWECHMVQMVVRAVKLLV